MRVAQVIASLRPEGGGLPKSAVAIAASLARRGVDSAMICFASTKDAAKTRVEFGAFPGYGRIKFYNMTPGGLKALSSGALNRALADFSPDLIHTHGLWEPVLAHAQRYALRQGVPFVVMPHSMLHPWQSRHRKIPKWILQHLLGWKFRWKKAAFVQVLSEAEAGHWQAEGVVRTRLIANGIFPDEATGADAPLPFPWADKDYVLSLARLHAQKSPDLLIQAFALLAAGRPGLHLVLAGPDYGMKKALTAQAAALELSERIHFPGALAGEAKWTALHGCTCFCLPSRAEGFSLALLEAALAGAPSVISDECYFPQLVEAGGALRSDLSVEALAEKISQVLDAPAGMGAAARSLVLEAYTWPLITDQIMAAYLEACA